MVNQTSHLSSQTYELLQSTYGIYGNPIEFINTLTNTIKKNYGMKEFIPSEHAELLLIGTKAIISIYDEQIVILHYNNISVAFKINSEELDFHYVENKVLKYRSEIYTSHTDLGEKILLWICNRISNNNFNYDTFKLMKELINRFDI